MRRNPSIHHSPNTHLHETTHITVLDIYFKMKELLPPPIFSHNIPKYINSFSIFTAFRNEPELLKILTPLLNTNLL
jgi:hypothetical protein